MSIKTAIKNLEGVFVPYPIDPDSAFTEWGSTYPYAADFANAVRGKLWTELPPVFLEQAHDALVFLGPSALADYLPAFLSTVLRRDRELDVLPSFLLGVLTRGADIERFDARFARITPSQRQAIAEALVAFAAELEGAPRQNAVVEALESHWRPSVGRKDG